MAIQDITKPMALDETLQATNQALGGVAKDTSLQATNTALGLLGKDSSLQAIVTALATIGLNTVGNLAQLTTEQKTSLVAAINELMAGKISTSAKGSANGVAELDANGLVPANQLPSFVDDVLNGTAQNVTETGAGTYSATAFILKGESTPCTPEDGKTYVDITSDIQYRWTGIVFVSMGSNLALGETNRTAYRGDRGKTAYDHSQDASRVTSAIVEGLYKIGATAQGHISSLSAVQKSDITALGIPGQDTTYNDATQSVHGLMSANDKTKLDGISTGANKVEDSSTNGNIKIDNVETQVYDDSDIQGKISTALTPISGNPISISGLKSTQLAVAPVITFEPIQAGSGTPSPENIRAISGYDKIEVLSCGKNLVDESTVDIRDVTGTGTYRAGLAPILLKAGTYTISWASKTVDLYLTHLKDYSRDDVNTNPYIFTLSQTEWVMLRSGAYNVSQWDVVHPQIEEGSSATTYVPYHKTTDLSESLGQTVYWGRLKPRTGEFEVLGTIYDLGDLTWIYDSQYQRFGSTTAPTNIKLPSNPRVQTCWYSCYENIDDGRPVAEVTSGQAYTVADGTVYIHDNRYTDATAFKTAVTGQKIVYELKDSAKFTIQLTPHEISLLEQYAYLSTNGTLIQLSYHHGEMASLGDVSQLGETVERGFTLFPTFIFPDVEIFDKEVTVASPFSIDLTKLKNIFYIVTSNYTTGSWVLYGILGKRGNTWSYRGIYTSESITATLSGTTLSFVVTSGYGANYVSLVALY